MPIQGIDAVTFGVTDFGRAVQFLEDWGLRKSSARASRPGSKSGAARAVYRCVDGSELTVRPADDPDLPPAVEGGSTLRSIVWGVSAQRDLDRLARELGRDRAVRRDRTGTLWSTDDMGVTIGFRLSRRKRVAPAPIEVNAPGRVMRTDRTAPFYSQAEPREFSHVVFGAPDHEAVERFYTERLGFHVSDRYDGKAVFLRASPSGNHHHLFVLTSADAQVHFNHLAFKVRDVHEVIGGGQHIAARGWETQAGPGRHFPSSAIFWYFKSPLGGAMEYAADEDMVTPKWRPRTMTLSPDRFSEWTFQSGGGMAGAPISTAK